MNFNIFKKNYQKPKTAWFLFIILIMSSLISDYILRLKSIDFYSNGLNENIWFGIYIILSGKWGSVSVLSIRRRLVM